MQDVVWDEVGGMVCDALCSMRCRRWYGMQYVVWDSVGGIVCSMWYGS